MAFPGWVCHYIQACRKSCLLCTNSCCCYPHVRNHEKKSTSGSPVSSTVTAEQFWWHRQVVQKSKKTRCAFRGNERYLQSMEDPSQYQNEGNNFDEKEKWPASISTNSITDLADNQKFGRFNDGVKYILMLVDCFLRHAWAIQVVSKTPTKNLNQFSQSPWSGGYAFKNSKCYVQNNLSVLSRVRVYIYHHNNQWCWVCNDGRLKQNNLKSTVIVHDTVELISVHRGLTRGCGFMQQYRLLWYLVRFFHCHSRSPHDDSWKITATARQLQRNAATIDNPSVRKALL